MSQSVCANDPSVLASGPMEIPLPLYWPCGAMTAESDTRVKETKGLEKRDIRTCIALNKRPAPNGTSRLSRRFARASLGPKNKKTSTEASPREPLSDKKI